MLLIGMLFALFTVGFVVPCLIDVARTPQFAIRSLTKRTWVLVIVLLSVIGAGAWLIAGRPTRSWHAPINYRHLAGLRGIRQQEAFRRHPAGRIDELGLEVLAGYDARHGYLRPPGPDDDPDFLKELDRRIRDDREADNDA
jgi:Phospholipase_D-nuclease N-terminal